MTVKELKEALVGFPDDTRVGAQDGLSPSDVCEVTSLDLVTNDFGVGYVQISAHGDQCDYFKF